MHWKQEPAERRFTIDASETEWRVIKSEIISLYAAANIAGEKVDNVLSFADMLETMLER